jgi:hypothetical protein
MQLFWDGFCQKCSLCSATCLNHTKVEIIILGECELRKFLATLCLDLMMDVNNAKRSLRLNSTFAAAQKEGTDEKNEGTYNICTYHICM